MTRRSAGPAVLAALLATASSGCVTAPVRLGHAQLASGRAVRAQGRAESPEPRGGAALPVVLFEPVVDGRAAGSEELGAIGGRPFSAGELVTWVDRELSGLGTASFTVARQPPAGGPPALTVRLRVLKAYVQSVNVTKAAVVVLQAQLEQPAGAAPVTRTVRGQHASLNWASGEGEVTEALREALDACLDQLRADVESRLYPGGVPAELVWRPPEPEPESR